LAIIAQSAGPAALELLLDITAAERPQAVEQPRAQAARPFEGAADRLGREPVDAGPSGAQPEAALPGGLFWGEL
jgi:hypothetical protein